MEGTGPKPPSKQIVKVRQGFEWSRLESEVMTSAYERIVPAGGRASAKTLAAGDPRGGREWAGLDGERRRQATGA